MTVARPRPKKPTLVECAERTTRAFDLLADFLNKRVPDEELKRLTAVDHLVLLDIAARIALATEE